jgi:hypothetical protein
MDMRGRYPDGPEELLEPLDGTAEDKQRVHVILDTVFGSGRVLQACAQLGIGETRFRQLRERVLQGALEGVRPRVGGRRRQQVVADVECMAELERELVEARLALQEAQVRTEVALILPQREEEPVKKGPRSSVKLRKRKPR